MSIVDSFVHGLYRVLVHTVMAPLRNSAFESTRKAKISDTEKEALSSGSVGFEREILGGAPDWRKLNDMPPPALTPEEQAFLDGPLEELCAMLDDWHIRNELKDLPPEVWAFMKKYKFFGMIIPKEYEGLGFSAQAHSAVVLKLGSRSTTACVTAMVPNSLGPAELLMRYGTDEQKKHYLPRLARGEEIPSFALSEPNAGSDASGMTSNGVVCEQDGQLGIRLNWEKRYITLSPITTLLGLAFKLKDPDGLLGGKKDLGITLALIPANTPGVNVGRRHNPLGIPFQNGPTTGKDVWIPLNHIIGEREYAGQGWRMLMECLSVGRSVSLPALSTGSSKLVCRIAGAYSRVRKQFKVAIGQFEGVEELLARMAGTAYWMEGTRLATLQMLDRGEHPTILSAVLKYHMTEAGRRIVNDGMDILGGKAICEGPDNLLAPLYHGTPIGITVEGANILTRNMIIFGQASVRSHPYILMEMEAARMENKDEARKKFSDLMARHVRHSVDNTFRSLIFGMFDGAFSNIPKGVTKEQQKYYRHINRLSAAYATLADMTLMLLGDSVKRKERISALLGDTMSYLYLASCTLRHFTMQGKPDEDIPLMRWACQDLLYHAEESLDRLLQNFPSPVMAIGLRMVVFPAGRRFRPPSHRLERQVAKTLLLPGTARNRLTSGIYIPTTEREPLGLLEQCFTAVIKSETIETLVRQAKKEGRLLSEGTDALLKEAVEKDIITARDLDHMRHTEQLRQRAIKVDDFNAAFGMESIESLQAVEEGLALADEKTLKSKYPVGTRWNIDIPDIDLVRLMDDTLVRYSDFDCIDFLGKKYTYKETGSLINKAAAGLQSMGVKKGDRIALLMANTPYYPIMFFAALKAGAVVVNCCPMQTTAELKAQMEDSGARIMITLDILDMYQKARDLQKIGALDHVVVCRMEDALPFFKAQAYRILRASHIARPEELHLEGQAHGKTAPIVLLKDLLTGNDSFHAPLLHPDDLAVLQYTGGTTGSPKGAMLSHRNVVANVCQIEEYFRASGDKPDSATFLRYGKERVLDSIPFFHIFGLTVAMITCLKMGSELIILPDPRNMKDTVKTIHEKKPTVFPAVPRLLQAISEYPRAGAYDLSHLSAVISGGAALADNVYNHFQDTVHKAGIVKQGYGLTEASPVVSSNPPIGLNKPESVGLPIPKTSIKITDPDDPERLLKLGETGEVLVCGPQVMQGYYNRDAETHDVLYNGWLRTGDLGYLDEDYYLHIVDRKKRLIIVNGINVYPTQVEQAIAEHPAVAECIVVSVPSDRSGEAAKAFIRLKNGLDHRPDFQEITDFLSPRLSRMEIPKFIEFVMTELPKTAVGKPDWKKLQDEERLKFEEGEKSTA